MTGNAGAGQEAGLSALDIVQAAGNTGVIQIWDH
jgi:hypothetical protein